MKLLVWLVGTLGSGKTTLIKNTLQYSTLEGRTAAIVNDGGTQQTVDAAILEKYGTVATMSNGCFTCQDLGGLEQLMTTLVPEFDVIIVEGFGFISGHESVSAASQISKRFGMRHAVVSLLDAEHLEENLQCYAQILASQLQAATSAVLINKLTGEPDGALLELISRNTRAPVFEMQHTTGIKPEMLQRKGLVVRAARAASLHDHAHGACTHWASLRSDVTMLDIRIALDTLASHGMLRAKGACSGLHFDRVHDTVHTGEADHRCFVTAYFLEPCNELWDQIIGPLRQNNDDLGVATTIDLMRANRTTSLQERIALAEKLMSRMPTTPAVRNKRIVTHPEQLQIAKEFCRQPDINSLVYPTLIRRACEYWYRCAELLLDTSQIIDRDTAMRELGISLCWWVLKMPDALESELITKICKLEPWLLVQQGYLQLTTTHTPNATEQDTDQGKWQAKEFEAAAELARLHGVQLCAFANLANRMFSLYAIQRPEYTSAIDEWRRVANSLTHNF